MAPLRPPGKPREVAAYVRRSEGTLANWRYLDIGPKYTKAGGQILYDWDDVEAWLKSRAVDPASNRRRMLRPAHPGQRGTAADAG